MDENERLDNHEWIVVISLITLIGIVTFITHKHWFSTYSRQYSNPHYVYDEKIHVRIEGAVESPGIYSIKRNTPLKDVLVQAQPTSQADLKKVSTKKLKDGQTIIIPQKEFITIYLEGAVKKQGALVVPKGTKVEELLILIEMDDQADLSKLNFRRRLKEGDIIKIPYVKNRE